MSEVVNITVKIPPESQAIIGMLEPEFVMPVIGRGMDKALAIVRGRIQEQRLSGVGPFNPGFHRLGERSGKLKESLQSFPSTVTGSIVTGVISANQFYSEVHEFGMVIKGNPLMIFQVESQAVFVIGQPPGGSYPYSRTRTVFARQVTIPARAPLRTGVEENADYIAETIASEIDWSYPVSK